MKFTPRAIGDLMAEAIRAEGRLPDVELLPGERMAMSGHLFEEDWLFTTYVARALADQPKLFTDVPAEVYAPGGPDGGHTLKEDQARATALLNLFNVYERLVQRTWDAYLLTQSNATQRAMTVVRQVRADEERPFPHPESNERRMALLQAEE